MIMDEVSWNSDEGRTKEVMRSTMKARMKSFDNGAMVLGILPRYRFHASWFAWRERRFKVGFLHTGDEQQQAARPPHE
jgi:hypothetical protein